MDRNSFPVSRSLIVFIVLLHLSFPVLRADEGLWLPVLIEQKILSMQKLGSELSAEDIYSINKACLKDAIVHFDRGCTAEIISYRGLLITNHHCGYDAIQSHSTVEHDYLTDGFWAMSADEELPNPGLTVSFLRSMRDVSQEALAGVSDTMSETERKARIAQNAVAIVQKATAGTTFTAEVKPLYYGNQYFLYVEETYTDVRLVAAPPSSIGKFGGDTDNWIWPRHTGDFSIFRIYANADNRPAAYSRDNRPYRPEKALTISLGGVREGDFTMIYGYPGRTREYIVSDEVDFIARVSNPRKIALRSLRLKVFKEAMNADPKVRIQYASKAASVSNAWKKWQGEMKGLLRLNTLARKRDYERRFALWAQDKPRYRDIVARLHTLYDSLAPYAYAADYYNESVMAVELTKFAGKLHSLILKSRDENNAERRESVKQAMDAFYKDYYCPADRQVFALMMRAFIDNVDPSLQPDFMQELPREYKDNPEIWARNLFDSSLLASAETAYCALKSDRFEELLQKDAALKLYRAFYDKFRKDIREPMSVLNDSIDLLYRDYMQGQMAFDTQRVFYPDANSTLRVSYGRVCGYRPADGIRYLPLSTLEGIIEKDRPDIYDYNIPQRLRDIHAQKDYGDWEYQGTVPVAFIASNHTTGGNSGSPVLNARGQLLGLNFDRVWEGTMSDIEFDPAVCRNIAVDIRYVLFIIDKIGEASYLFDEMNFSR